MKGEKKRKEIEKQAMLFESVECFIRWICHQILVRMLDLTVKQGTASTVEHEDNNALQSTDCLFTLTTAGEVDVCAGD